MAAPTYFAPTGGHPPQTELMTGRAVFTEAYAVIPKGVMQDIVTSCLPHWEGTRAWIIARPLSGFAETFSWYVVEVAPGGGSERPDDDPDAEAVLLVVGGTVVLTIDGVVHRLGPGGYAFLPPDAGWALRNEGDEHATFHWIRKAYERVDGVEVEAGDFMWLRAFCPQACYAGGPGRFRYLLYQDVNRHPKLGLR